MNDLALKRFRECQAAHLESWGLQAKFREIRLEPLGMQAGVLVAGEGEPLLLVHGGSGLADDWAPLAARLRDRFRLYMLYLPGHGLADPVDFRRVDGRSFVPRFLAAAMDALGLEKVGVVGNSVGGYFSLAFALDHPERVTRLVLIGNPGGFEQRVPLFFRMGSVPGVGELMWWLARFQGPERVRKALGLVVAHPERLSPAYIELIRAHTSLIAAGGGYISMVRRLIHSMQPIRGELEHLEPPVLFIWGEKDCFGFPEAAAALSDGERVRLARLADAGHLPWLDEPTLTAELIAGFLAGQ